MKEAGKQSSNWGAFNWKFIGWKNLSTEPVSEPVNQ